MGLWEDINDMPKEDVIDLLVEYDNYLERARDEGRFEEGWVPVCLAEFYGAEYQISVEDREREANMIADEAGIDG